MLANRLSAKNDVLLVEAGPGDKDSVWSVTMHAPGLSAFNLGTKFYNFKMVISKSYCQCDGQIYLWIVQSACYPQSLKEMFACPPHHL